jgi:hypothetical protein
LRGLFDNNTQVTIIDDLPLSGWRAETGFKHDREATAADVVRYEQEILGNPLGVDEHAVRALETIPARNMLWVTSNRADALEYGDDVRTVSLAGAKLIARDTDGGLLVLLDEPSRL